MTDEVDCLANRTCGIQMMLWTELTLHSVRQQFKTYIVADILNSSTVFYENGNQCCFGSP